MRVLSGRGFGLVLASVLMGCQGGEPTEVLAMEPPAASYGRGACVSLVIANPRAGPMEVDHCALRMEHLVEEGWKPVSEQTPPASGTYACSYFELVVPSGGRAGSDLTLGDSEDGTYRFRIDVRFPGADEDWQSIPGEVFTLSGESNQAECASTTWHQL